MTQQTSADGLRDTSSVQLSGDGFSDGVEERPLVEAEAGLQPAEAFADGISPVTEHVLPQSG